MNRYDLMIPQGTTFRRRWPLLDPEGEALVVTGYTARAQVRADRGSDEVLAEWTTENGALELTNGFLDLTVTPAASSAWTWLSGEWDMEVEDSDGVVTRVVQGDVTVDPEATR